MADAGDRSVELQEDHMQRAMAARRARTARPSAEFCRECDEPIPERRRELIEGVQLCVDCQAIAERRQ